MNKQPTPELRYPERSNVRYQGEWWLVKEATLASETNDPEKGNLYVLTQPNRNWKIYPKTVFESELYAENQESLPPGTRVVSKTRMPTALQPWIHPIWFGTVEEPGDDPEQWNKHNSERHYCDLLCLTKVRWDFREHGEEILYDRRQDLVPVTPEQEALSWGAQIMLFIGEEAFTNWNRSRGIELTEDEKKEIERHDPIYPSAI